MLCPPTNAEKLLNINLWIFSVPGLPASLSLQFPRNCRRKHVASAACLFRLKYVWRLDGFGEWPSFWLSMCRYIFKYLRSDPKCSWWSQTLLCFYQAMCGRDLRTPWDAWRWKSVFWHLQDSYMFLALPSWTCKQMQWPLCSLAYGRGRTGLARVFLGKMSSEVGLISVAQIWYGKFKPLFVLCFYESACFTSCAHKRLRIMQNVVHW